MEAEEQRLPVWLEEKIKRQNRDGVSYSRPWREDGGLNQVTAIHWRPGESNVLAESIIEKVTETPMPLVLDGHLYMIHRALGKLVEDEVTGGVIFWKDADGRESGDLEKG